MCPSGIALSRPHQIIAIKASYCVFIDLKSVSH